MIGRTLGFYIGRRVGMAIILMFLAVASLIYVVDVIEMLRKAGDRPTASVEAVALLCLYRVPAIAERTLPFAVLFGAMAGFLMLSQRLELVVARSTGISAWQFITPAIIVALLYGVLATTVYNPLAARFSERAETMEAKLLGGPDASSKVRWIRQASVDGQAILRAQASADQGRTLLTLIAFVFDKDGRFQERIEAEKATLRDGYWELTHARVVGPEIESSSAETYLLATNLTASQVADTFSSGDSLSFWQLPEVIELTRRAGLSATRFTLQFQTLLARPVLLVAMILIASTVSLGFFRMGGIARMILGGVVAGFVLYVVTKLAEDLGNAGFIGAAPAAWVPALVGTLASVTVLFHQEDG